MRFGERIIVFIFRPIYRTFFERLFWWFLARVKVFLLADIAAQLQSIDQRLRTVEQQHAAAASRNAAQWDALEQLLLALFRASNASDLAESRNESHAAVSPDLETARAATSFR